MANSKRNERGHIRSSEGSQHSIVAAHMNFSSTHLMRLIFLIVTLAAFPNALRAQFKTPVIDGVISPGEYGNTENATNQIATNTNQTWYMTWNATNLYVAITVANLSQGAIIYINSHPIFPVGSGTDAEGNLTGFNYDNSDFSVLPFRANFVTYFKDGYNEYRTSDGAGNWTAPTSYFGSYASNSATITREFAIPWNDITGGHGRPASFLFLGYLTSSGGYVYGQVPNDNPGAFIGTSAIYTQYFDVASTANGSSTPPFSIEPPYPVVGNIISKTGPANARVWTLQMTNQGNASVTPVIDSFTLTQTFGAACTPVVSTALPETTDEISYRESANGSVTLDFTGCASNSRFTAKFKFHTAYGSGSVTRYNQFE
jgi:hypothetical protein